MKKNLFFLLFCFQIAHSQTNTFRGRVVDTYKKAVSGVIVMLPGASTETDSLGYFRIEKVPTGRYVVSVRKTGYAQTNVPEVIFNTGKETVLEIILTEKVQDLDEVTIRPTTSTQPLASRIFSVEEVQRFAANYLDPARLVTSFPGVGATNDQANHLVIRGNTPNGLQFRLEGVDIVAPNHLSNAGTATDRPSFMGGGVNALSTQLLANTRFTTGNFATGIGNATAGLMDMALRKGNDEKHEFTFQPSVIGLDFSAEGPLKKGQASYLFNYRYSFTGLLGAMGVKLGEEDIRYQDFSLILATKFRKNGLLKFFSTFGNSSNNLVPMADSTQWKTEKDRSEVRFTSNLFVVGGSIENRIGSRGFIRSAAAISGRTDMREGRLITRNPFLRDSLQHLQASWNTTAGYRFNGNNNLSVGAIFTWMYAKISNGTPVFKYASDNGGEVGIVQIWGNQQVQILPNLEASFGLHVSKYSDQNTRTEPRAWLRWKPLENTSITLAVGQHSQLRLPTGMGLYVVSKEVYAGYLTIQRPLDLLVSNQFSLAGRLQTTSKAVICGEIYYHKYSGVAVHSSRKSAFSGLNEFETTFTDNLVGNGTGRNYGIEASLEKALLQQWYYVFSGALYEAKTTGSDGIERDGRFNGKYNFATTIGKEITLKKKSRIFGFHLRGFVRGGYREMPIDLVQSAFNSRTIFSESSGYSQQLSAFKRLDIRISMKRQRNNYTRTWAVDLQNALGIQNIAYNYYDSFQKKIVPQYQLGLIPVLSWRIDF